MNCDLVIESGGAKGVGIVGALTALEAQGFVPARVAGSSVGSIVSALIAAGYTGLETRKIMTDLNFKSFLSGGVLGTKALNLFFKRGVYSSKNIHVIMSKLLAAKGVRTFGDIKTTKFGTEQYPLKVFISDITNRRLVVLPDDAYLYGWDPNKIEIGWAVRASCSIPGFFRPVVNGSTFFVDGGLLSNFPIWTFDSPTPRWPTFGLLLQEEVGRTQIGCLPHSYASAILATALSAHDKMFLRPEEYNYRTIRIPVGRVRATDFGLSQDVKNTLYDNGVRATNNFLDGWTWDKYQAWALNTRRM